MAHEKRSARQLPSQRNRKEFRREEEINPALDPKQRSQQISKVLWLTLGLNWVIAVFKIVFGWSTQCMVIMADGFHSLADGASNIVGLVAVGIAGTPADHDHPYGHQKFETFASILISFFLFFVAITIGREAVDGLFHPKVPEVTTVSFVLMAATFGVNIGVVWYERFQGARLKSDFLISDSWHTITDLFLTVSVLLALIGIRLGWTRLDSLFSVGIAVMILFAAFKILKRGLDVLVDRAVLNPQRVKEMVLSVEGVKDCHEIRTRGHRDNIFMDLHVLVDGSMSVASSHQVASRVENRLKKEIQGLADVVVHIEPLSHEHDNL